MLAFFGRMEKNKKQQRTSRLVRRACMLSGSDFQLSKVFDPTACQAYLDCCCLVVSLSPWEEWCRNFGCVSETLLFQASQTVADGKREHGFFFAAALSLPWVDPPRTGEPQARISTGDLERLIGLHGRRAKSYVHGFDGARRVWSHLKHGRYAHQGYKIW